MTAQFDFALHVAYGLGWDGTRDQGAVERRARLLVKKLKGRALAFIRSDVAFITAAPRSVGLIHPWRLV